jgi:hypothetical protein
MEHLLPLASVSQIGSAVVGVAASVCMCVVPLG